MSVDSPCCRKGKQAESVELLHPSQSERFAFRRHDRDGRARRCFRPNSLVRPALLMLFQHHRIRRHLNWAKRQDMLRDIPKIDMPKRAKGAKMVKARPVTGEEFDRLIVVDAETPGVKSEDVDLPSGQKGQPGESTQTIVTKDRNEVRVLGLEPKTYGLKVRCSTN